MDDNLRQKVRSVLQGRDSQTSSDFRSKVRSTLQNPEYKSGGLAWSVAKAAPGFIAEKTGEYLDKEQEVRKDLTVGEDFFRTFVKKPAAIYKTLAQGAVGGMLSLGRSTQEAVATPFVGKEKAQEIGTGKSMWGETNVNQFLTGQEEVQSYQDIYREVDKFVGESPVATDWEKTYLPATLAFGMFALDAWPGKPNIKKEVSRVIEDIAKGTTEKEIRDALISGGIDKTIARNLAPRLITANDTNTVREVIQREAGDLFGEAAKEQASRTGSATARQTTTRTTPTQSPTQPRQFDIPKRVEQPVRQSTPDVTAPQTKPPTVSSKEAMRARVKSALEKEQYVKDEVMPDYSSNPQRAVENLTDMGRDTLSYVVDTIRRGREVMIPKNVETNFRSLAGAMGLNTDKKLNDLVNDMVKKLDEMDTAVTKKLETPPDFFWQQGSSRPDYLRNNRQAGFANFLGDADGAKNLKQTAAGKRVASEIDRNANINELVTGPDATGQAGRQGVDSAPASAPQATPQQQPVSTPTKTNSNSPVLSSLEQSNPKKAEVASKEYTDYSKAVNKVINSRWLKIREMAQDAFIKMRKLQEAVAGGKAIPDDINVEQAETLFHGRVHVKLEEVGQTVREIDKSIVESAKKNNVSADEMRTDVDSYLQALHAPERNAKLGDGAAGMTNAEAKATMDALKASGRYDAIKEQADKLLDLNRKTLDILKEGQLIDEATYNLLRQTYKNHVPLLRVMNEADDMTALLSGKGFDVKSSGLKKAKGSDRDVADITGNIVQMVEQAIIRSEKNLVNLTTARWARANKDLGIIKEVKPKATGKTFDEGGVVLEDLSRKPNIITFFEDGKKKFLEVQDEGLAKVLKGVNVETVPTILRPIAFVTRLYGQLHTRFNYEFAFSNVIRDVQEMAVDMSARKGMGFGGAGKSAARVPVNQKAVADFIFGRDTEGARLYKQMREDGGTTGGLGLSSRQDIDMEIQRIQKLNQSNPRKAAEAVLRAIDKWNMIFEDATRLGVYRTALERGLSRKQAAVLAKESTINFNKKGTSGPIVNGLYMFSNASIQGTTKVLRAMKNPKVAAAVTISMFAAVESANQWNDSVDPEWRKKVTKWDRSANLVIMFPTEDGSANYMTIPISWGLKPIKMSAEYISDLSKGQIDPIDGIQGILTSVLQAYNPLAGDESLLRTLTPTVLKTPVEISSNRGWHGNQIKPAYDVDAPASSQYFASLGNSVSGRFFINATEELSNRNVMEVSPADLDYAFNQYIGGVGRSVNKLSSAIANIGEDDPLPANQRPILSRFFRTRTQEQVFNDMFYTERQQADEEKARERVLDKRRVQPIYEEAQVLLQSGNKEAAQSLVDSLSDEDYEVYKKLKATDTRRGNTAAQIEQYSNVRKIEELMAEGKRSEAQRIVDEMTDEEYEAYKKAKAALGVDY